MALGYVRPPELHHPGAPLMRRAMAEAAEAERAAGVALMRVREREALQAAAYADRAAMFSSVLKWQQETPPLMPAWEHRAEWRRTLHSLSPRFPREHIPSFVPSPRSAEKLGVFTAVASPHLGPPPGNPAREAAGLAFLLAPLTTTTTSNSTYLLPSALL
eukprot:Hpha_TRINITY_DN10553_c0_g1::TRINITY_DN10553_c0_g1_i2::g.31595::m.31595